MRGDVDLRDIRLSKLRLSSRVWVLLGAVALLGAGVFLAWTYVNHPPRPWLVRWKLDRYLKKEAHTGNFKVDFPFPSKAEMAQPARESLEPVKGSRTGKDFDTLRNEYLGLKLAAVRLEQAAERATRSNQNATSVGSNQPDAAPSVARTELAAKEQSLAPIVDDLWEFQRRWAVETSDPAVGETLAKGRAEFARSIEQGLESAGSYDAMYLAIGRELFVASHLLESHHPAHRRVGVTVASTAARHALNYAVNGNVAARICEGYILPNLDLATDTNPRSAFNHENFLSMCADLFRRNNEFNNVVRTYELYLASAKNPARVDWARSQIAIAHEDGGNPKAAIAAIRQIKDTNSYSRFIRRIPRLEQDAGLKR
jgi:hypothetical protein